MHQSDDLSLMRGERDQWAQRYYESGLTQREFGVRHGLELPTLQRWVAQNSPRTRGAANAAFTEVQLPRLTAAPGWVAEVVRLDGAVVRLGNDIAPALLHQLLRLC